MYFAFLSYFLLVKKKKKNNKNKDTIHIRLVNIHEKYPSCPFSMDTHYF